MKNNKLARRSLISGLGLGVAALAAGSKTAIAQTQAGQFRPARHSQDAWFDTVHGTHRNFIDASTTSGAAEAMLYANNLYEANKTGYSLSESDIAIVICLRHFATAFAYNDVIWGKYG